MSDLPNNKLIQLERALEQRLIDLRKATDGAGLKVNITPHTPQAVAFRDKIAELLGLVEAKRIEYRGEEALARNVGLLAAAWEASVRYWDFQRELSK